MWARRGCAPIEPRTIALPTRPRRVHSRIRQRIHLAAPHLAARPVDARHAAVGDGPERARLDLLDPYEVSRLGGIEVTTRGVVEGFHLLPVLRLEGEVRGDER